MLLILMRHGIAEPLSAQINVDAARPLSLKGRDVTAQVAQGLHQLLPPLELIAHSPKVRARETAELVRNTMIEPPALLEEWDELLLDDDFRFLEDRVIASRADTLMLVGHEPNLSLFAAWLLARDAKELRIEFKKASVCALEVTWEGDLPLPSATLLWTAPPKLMRRLSS